MVILKILFKPVSMMCRSDLRKREPTEKKQFLLPGQGEEEVYSHTNPPKVFIALELQILQCGVEYYRGAKPIYDQILRC